MALNSPWDEVIKPVLLILSDKGENVRLFRELFGHVGRVLTASEFDFERNGFDLCVLDANWLGQYGRLVQRKKREQADTYLPLLGLLSGDTPESVISEFDEIVRFPCTKAELSHRVENLLRVRKFSLEIKALLTQARGDVVGLEQEKAAIIGSEQRAINSTRQLMLLADSLPQMVWTADKMGSIDYANQRWYAYTGLKPGSEHGLTFSKFIHPDDAAATSEAYREALNHRKALQLENRFRRFDGTYRWFLIRAVPVFDESVGGGEVVKWFGTCTDVEEKKRHEDFLLRQKSEAENANQTKSAFLANMSHEIRTPLGVIVGFSSLLKNSRLAPDERDHYVDAIIRNGRALTTIIDDILDLAKVEAGKIVIEELSFSLVELLTECVEMFRDKARQKNLFLILNIDEASPTSVRSDPTRVRQILINLIGNAIKFTEEGGIQVSAKVRAGDDGGVICQILIKDSGIGLSAEQIERLFQPFVQADDTTTRKFGGTGLGLTLSKRLANALGGDITIQESVLGAGCTFVVTFKAGTAQSQVATGGAARLGSEDEIKLSELEILVVDDSPDNLFLISRLLQILGAKATTVESGEEALEICAKQGFDCVLLDIQMPGMDGFDTLSRLRGQGYVKPIIALTAHAMLEERQRTKAAGFGGHVTKPIERRDLALTIRAAIKELGELAQGSL